MWKKLKRKLKSQKGFSLTEVLAAVLILSMVSSVVAGGIPVARDAYEKVTLSANAQVMLSTAITALRNELSTASEIKSDGAKKIEYYSAAIKNQCAIGITDQTGRENGGIWQTLYSSSDADTQIWKKLVSDAVGAEKPGENRLFVTYNTISAPVNGIVTVTGLRVLDSKQGNKILAHMDSNLKIRVIMGK